MIKISPSDVIASPRFFEHRAPPKPVGRRWAKIAKKTEGGAAIQYYLFARSAQNGCFVKYMDCRASLRSGFAGLGRLAMTIFLYITTTYKTYPLCLTFLPLLLLTLGAQAHQSTPSDKLIALAAKIQDHEAQLTFIEQDLTKARAEEARILAELNQRNQQIMNTINYLRHASQYSPLLAMLTASKPEHIIHSSVLLRSVTPEITTRNKQLIEKIQHLTQIRLQLEVKQNQLQDLTFQYHQEHEALGQMMRDHPYHSGPLPADPSTANTFLAPVVGVIVPTYGNTSPEWAHYSQGILMNTRHGAHVVSPLSGTIAFAGDYAQNQGKMVIVQTKSAHVVLSGLETLVCTVGQTVRAGEPVGRMPQTTSKDNVSAPQLYMEVWKQDQTVDPQTVLKG